MTTVSELGPWFQNLHLPDGTQTAPDHPLGDYPKYKWETIYPFLPEDLRGWRALDVGCNAGFYSIALARRGADVVGIDHDPHYLTQAEWAAGVFDVRDRVRFEQRQVYDLARDDDTYDLVLFLGVLYHLRYPLLGLDIVAQRVGRMMIFQSLTMPGLDVQEPPPDLALSERDRLVEPGWPRMAFIERRMAQDPTNWWAPDHACVLALLRSAGMRVVATPGEEVYVCEPDRASASHALFDEKELRAATGRSGNGRSR